MTPLEALAERGWVRLPQDPDLARWAISARPVAEEMLADPHQREAWLRYGGTWFAGVNAFPNAPDGSVPWRVPPLSGRALRLACESVGLTEVPLDPAQISIVLPGYPQPDPTETEANFRYRLTRDAAHLDGLLKGHQRQRFLREVHGFILGIPLTETPEDASPVVVWQGSHKRLRAALLQRFEGIAPEDWAEEDVAEIYVDTRREIFQTCPRVVLHARPGEAYIIHRLALHGVAPWGAGAGWAPRIIAYFRPDPFPGHAPDWWLTRS